MRLEDHQKMDDCVDPTPRPIRLMMFLYLAIFLGLLTVGISFFYGQRDLTANTSVARQNQEFLRRIEELGKEQRAENREHRLRNEELHSDICRLIFEFTKGNPKYAFIEPCDPPLKNGEEL